MKSYLNAKLILFKQILKEKTTIITDQGIDQFFLLKKIAKKRNLKLINLNEEFKKIKSQNKFEFNNGFKIKNLAMAVKAAKLCGLKENSIYRVLKKIKDVNGRLELIREYKNKIRVYIDYAHTPDALLKTLKFLKFNYRNNISLVFGCGGERDQKKRPLMAKIANDNCKKIYITDDNPRNENPKNKKRTFKTHSKT